MRVIITCGPGYEPVDEVRRLTNFSTGELGLMLSATMGAAGHEVLCLKGEGASSSLSPGSARVVSFSTNSSLLARLQELAADGADAIFHAAALCDYEVKSIHSADGSQMTARKIPTLAGELTLTLRPARKVLAGLRGLFPSARIVGWKYELNGSREAAVAKAREQILSNGTAACVVNGAAWGAGFGFVTRDGAPEPLADKAALCAFLVDWMCDRTSGGPSGCSPR